MNTMRIYNTLTGKHDEVVLASDARQVEAERDALAALLANASSAMDAVITYTPFDDGTTSVSLQRLQAVRDALNADPDASLDRLIAVKQAEVLEELAEEYYCVEEDMLLARAAELRHQADKIGNDPKGESS